ncbi:uncharacterized protein LOC134272979 isoform X2 [Saccostrea cucullata]|uniref:uncharacterized protein LOC134272979 isoform X2 n=1 Tax=Saccostrea cuccullata TaxID=36930 RepID=UPI002ED0EFC1
MEDHISSQLEKWEDSDSDIWTISPQKKIRSENVREVSEPVVDLTKSPIPLIVIPSSDEGSPSPKKTTVTSSPFKLLSSDSDTEDIFTPITPGTHRRNLTEEFDLELPYEYFLDDKTLPIFKKGVRQGVFTKETLKEMLNFQGQLATRVPLGVNINALFLIDTKKLGHHKDVLSDGCGVWKQTKTKVHYFKEICDKIEEVDENDHLSMDKGLTYKVTRLSYRHSASPDFHRIVIFAFKIKGETGLEIVSPLALQYYFENEEHKVIPQPHGNAKNGKTYHRTFQSVKNKIKEEINANSKPKEVVHKIILEKGGIHEINAPGEHVKNRQQVSSFKYAMKEERNGDPLLNLMELSKEQSLDKETAFVRDVSASPEMTVFMATKQQLTDIERFCTNADHFSVLGVDATFNVGKYFLTLTTYKHLMLMTKKQTHPVFIGPALIHQRRLFDSYFALPSNMIKYNPNLQGLLVYGSDGEKNLSDAFDSCFTNSKHLLCDIHMKDNIKKKLTDLSIKAEEATEYIQDIFGKQINSEKVPGLVDCFSSDEFDQKLESLKPLWTNRHPYGDEFLKYFTTFKADLIKNCMTADLRAMCGLGYPPSMYNQNANECANSVVKRNLKLEKLSVPDCVTHLQNIIQCQHDETRLALLGRGEYAISNNYKEYTVAEEKYYQMTRQQKVRLENNFFNATVKKDDPVSITPQNIRECTLSVPPENSQISKVAQHVVEDIFMTASSLLQNNENIVMAPGSDEKLFFVLNSFNKSTPHQVSCSGSKSQYMCDSNCIKWVTHKICPHTVAVAEHQQKLQNFLDWYNSKSKHPKYTSLSMFNMPSSRGKKATKSTSRRKGGNPNKKRQVLEKYVEAPIAGSISDNLIPALPNPSTGSYVIAMLDFCNPNVTKCFGCQGYFRENNQIPDSPRNLVIVSKMKRPYRGKDGTMKEGALSNVYFHLSEKCIKKQDPYFISSLVFCPEDLKGHLLPEHREYLTAANIKF